MPLIHYNTTKMNKINTKLIITPTLVAIMTVGLIANAIPSSVFAQNTGGNGGDGESSRT